MKKIISLLLALIAIISCFSFTTNAFAATKANVTAAWNEAGVKNANNSNFFYSKGKVYFFCTGKVQTPTKASVKVYDAKTKKAIEAKYYYFYNAPKSSAVGTYKLNVRLNADGYKKYTFTDSKNKATNTKTLSYQVIPAKAKNVVITKDTKNNKVNVSFTKGAGTKTTNMTARFFSKSDAGRINTVYNETTGTKFSFKLPKDSGFTELMYIELVSYNEGYRSVYRSKYEPFNTNKKETINAYFSQTGSNNYFSTEIGDYLNYGAEYNKGGYEYSFDRYSLNYVCTGNVITPAIKKYLQFDVRNENLFSGSYTCTIKTQKNVGVYTATIKLSDADFKKVQFPGGKQSANVKFMIIPAPPTNITVIGNKKTGDINVKYKKGLGASKTQLVCKISSVESLFCWTEETDVIISVPKNRKLPTTLRLKSRSDNNEVDAVFVDEYGYISKNITWK